MESIKLSISAFSPGRLHPLSAMDSQAMKALDDTQNGKEKTLAPKRHQCGSYRSKEE